MACTRIRVLPCGHVHICGSCHTEEGTGLLRLKRRKVAIGTLKLSFASPERCLSIAQPDGGRKERATNGRMPMQIHSPCRSWNQRTNRRSENHSLRDFSSS